MTERDRNFGKAVRLQEWANGNPPREEMSWKDGFWDQVVFVRDRLAPLIGVGLGYDEQKQIVTVISTHISKSIRLPVYQLERPDRDLQIILRNNFYNWKMSVLSETPIETDFSGLFHTTPPIEPEYTGDPLHPVYFEGFPNDFIFSYYADSDRRRWSAEIHSDEILYTTIYMIMRSLGHIKPLKWHTRESHQEELDRLSQRLNRA